MKYLGTLRSRSRSLLHLQSLLTEFSKSPADGYAWHTVLKAKDTNKISYTVTLAQLVKAPVGQAEVRRFLPHLGHNWLSCRVFLVNPGTLGSPWHEPKDQIGSLS